MPPPETFDSSHSPDGQHHLRFHIDEADDIESQLHTSGVELTNQGNQPNTQPPADFIHFNRPAAPTRAESAGLLAPTKSMRGQSYSSHNAAADGRTPPGPTVEDCFVPGYLETPLLTENKSTETAKHLFGTPPPRLALSWNNLNLYVPAPTPSDPNAKKKILSNVSGRAWTGETVAIMGPSGSGKTSLITQLAGGYRKSRAANNLTGDILVNGKPISKKFQRFIACVEQDDVLFANLSVEQTLRYSALLNLPKELTKEEKLDRVEQTIEILGLQKCRKTKIGGGFVRGISGGERKRTSIATEMLGNPSIILADEPTSGLDSTTAARLISTFRGLARGGRTILCSIHQPSSQIFDLFDKVILLAQGRMIFMGSPVQVADYFGSTGLMCKPHFNLADFMLELVSDLTVEAIEAEEAKNAAATGVDSRKLLTVNGSNASNDVEHAVNGHDGANGTAEKNVDPRDPSLNPRASALLLNNLAEASFATEGTSADRAIRRLPLVWASLNDELLKREDSYRLTQIKQDQEARPGDKSLPLSLEEQALADEAIESDSARWPLSWFEQLVLLLSRSFIQHQGNMITKIYVIQIVSICIISSLVWFQTKDDIGHLTERTGAIFFFQIFWSFTPLFNSLVAFPAERNVIVKERAHGSYRLSAYFVAKMLSEAPLELMYPIGFTIVWYWMTGLQPIAANFFYYILTILLGVLTAQAFGLLISCTLTDFKESVTFASVSMLALMLLSGFYVKLQNIPIWLRWASYLCFPKYVYSILAYIQFEGYQFECGEDGAKSSAGGPEFTTCPVDGSEIMSAYDFDLLPLGANIGILVAIAVFFRIFAYLSLRRTTQP